MDFTTIKTEIKDRLNLTSTADDTRIGRAINRLYREVTSTIGLQLSRRTPVQKIVTIGVQTVVFADTEKIINVQYRAVSPFITLTEITLEEMLEITAATSDSVRRYAIDDHTSDSVTIRLDVLPQKAFTLYADVHAAVADLTGTNEPAFPESYHDILIHGVLIDEYDKLEKVQLSAKAERRYEKRLGELRLWIAKSAYLDIYQGKAAKSTTASGSAGSGSSTVGATSYTQTGLITFNRTGAAVGSRYPFAVQTGSEKVANLDADLLDGLNSTAFARLDFANAGNLLFTDNTYDIGASGATRPRDLFLSRAVKLPDGSATVPPVTFASNPDTGEFLRAGVNISTTLDGVVRYERRASGDLALANSGAFSWTVGDATEGIDLILVRDAPNTFAQRNGTNAQAFNLYNTFTDASNLERARFLWSANAFSIQTQALGTGTNRTLGLGVNGEQWRINTSGHFLAVADNTNDIGQSGANRPRDLFLGRNATIGGTLGVTGVSTFTGAAVVGDLRTTEETITLTGTQNNFALGATTTILRCNNTTLLTLTGITGGTAGRILVIRSVGTAVVDLAHENLSSTAANRLANIATSAATSLGIAGSLTNGGCAIYQYDGAQSRWVLISHEQGAWITASFAAGNFTGSASMTWTVEVGDIATMAYRLIGRTIHIIVDIGSTTVAGTPDISLQISNAAWGGFSTTKQSLTPIRTIDNNAANIGFMFSVASGTDIKCRKVDSSNWTASTNLTSVEGNLTMEVN